MGFTSDTIPPEVVAGLPPWLQAQVPQYDKTKVPLIIATLTVCMTVACLAMALRLYSRHIARQAYGLDDLFAGLALIFTGGSVGLAAYMTDGLALGRHQIVVLLEHGHQFDLVNKFIISLTVIYMPIIFCLKASALFLYRRLFPSTRVHMVCYAILGMTAAYTLACVLTLLISCLPPIPPSEGSPIAALSCTNDWLNDSFLYMLIVNVALDFIILCLPLPLIWRLQTTTRRKLQLTFVFTLGSFIFAISIIRVMAVKNLGPADNWWDSTEGHLWSVAESAVAILTISLPVMQPALRQVIYKKDGSPRINISGNDSEKGTFDIITFGRTALKGPTGKKRRGMNMTTVDTAAGATLVDTGRHGSGAGLVAEDSRTSRETRTTDATIEAEGIGYAR